MAITAFDVAQAITGLEEIYAALAIAEKVTTLNRTTVCEDLCAEAFDTIRMLDESQVSAAETISIDLLSLAVKARSAIDRMREPHAWDRRALQAQGITQQG